jgi:hypothetical protein
VVALRAKSGPDQVSEFRNCLTVLDAGNDVTRLDSHMGRLLKRRSLDVYVELGLDYAPPIPISRTPPIPQIPAHEFEVDPDEYAGIVQMLEGRGNPVFDVFDIDTLECDPAGTLEHNRQRLERCGVRLSHLMIHPHESSPDIENLVPDWRQRHQDRRLYSDGAVAREIDGAGFTTTGMRGFRDRMRSAES